MENGIDVYTLRKALGALPDPKQHHLLNGDRVFNFEVPDRRTDYDMNHYQPYQGDVFLEKIYTAHVYGFRAKPTLKVDGVIAEYGWELVYWN